MLAKTKLLLTMLTAIVASLTLHAGTLAAEDRKPIDHYEIQPGDVLAVSVWKEEDLTLGVIVRPDGQITFPLVGEAKAAGSSVEDLRQFISERLKKYIPDPVVTVSVRELSGNTIYVIGKVNRPDYAPCPSNTLKWRKASVWSRILFCRPVMWWWCPRFLSPHRGQRDCSQMTIKGPTARAASLALNTIR